MSGGWGLHLLSLHFLSVVPLAIFFHSGSPIKNEVNCPETPEEVTHWARACSKVADAWDYWTWQDENIEWYLNGTLKGKFTTYKKVQDCPDWEWYIGYGDVGIDNCLSYCNKHPTCRWWHFDIIHSKCSLYETADDFIETASDRTGRRESNTPVCDYPVASKVIHINLPIFAISDLFW